MTKQILADICRAILKYHIPKGYVDSLKLHYHVEQLSLLSDWMGHEFELDLLYWRANDGERFIPRTPQEKEDQKQFENQLQKWIKKNGL
jgi:hypothetical protein